MENEYLLESILSYLPLPALTKARQVCKLWYQEATKHLRKSDNLITLSSPRAFRDFKATMDEHAKMTGLGLLFSKWSMVFDELALEDEAVQALLNSYGTFVRKLRVRFNWRILGNHPQTFKHLLSQQTPNLVELEFFGFPEPIWQQIHLFDENAPLLPNLKSLSCFTLIDYRHAYECPLYINILKCLRPQQLESLKINCNNYIRIIFDEAIATPRLHDALSGLKTFSMICPVSEYYGLESCQPIEELDTADMLTKICSKLQRLHLCLGYTAHSNSVAVICDRLANTLVELGLSNHCGRRLDFVWQGTLTSLPKVERATLLNPLYSVESKTTLANFPNLKYWKTNCCSVWSTPEPSKPLVVYPQLSTLVLEHVPQSNSHYETFTPEQVSIIGQSFPNLRTFHINRVNYQLVHAICFHLRNIEELRIESDLYDVAAQIDSGLTGFSSTNCYNILNNKDNMEFKSEESLRVHPYIGNLKRLQRLYIFASISGVSFRYGFSHLKELTCLCVEIARMRVENYRLMENKVERSDIEKCLQNMDRLTKLELVCEKPVVLSQESLAFDKEEFPRLELVVNGRRY